MRVGTFIRSIFLAVFLTQLIGFDTYLASLHAHEQGTNCIFASETGNDEKSDVVLAHSFSDNVDLSPLIEAGAPSTITLLPLAFSGTRYTQPRSPPQEFL